MDRTFCAGFLMGSVEERGWHTGEPSHPHPNHHSHSWDTLELKTDPSDWRAWAWGEEAMSLRAMLGVRLGG